MSKPGITTCQSAVCAERALKRAQLGVSGIPRLVKGLEVEETRRRAVIVVLGCSCVAKTRLFALPQELCLLSGASRRQALIAEKCSWADDEIAV